MIEYWLVFLAGAFAGRVIDGLLRREPHEKRKRSLPTERPVTRWSASPEWTAAGYSWPETEESDHSNA